MGKILLSLAIVSLIGVFYYFWVLRVDNQTLNDDIIVDFPQPNDLVSSPLRVSGRARGNWYFEASAPLRVEDSAGNVLGAKYITAQGDWMTTDFVPFEGEIEFTAPETPTGKIIFQKDNPSGLPEYDKSVEVIIKFKM